MAWVLAAGLGAVLVLAAVVQPLSVLGLLITVLFLAGYFFRRDLLLGAIFLALLFQNLLYIRLLSFNEQMANAVKHTDDLLLLFFVPALLLETFIPTVRLHERPWWKPFAVLVAICLLSAAANRLGAKDTIVGVYVLFKNFTWYFLAASFPISARGARVLVRYLLLVLGGVLAFGFVQLMTGELIYTLLGLPKDYRFGILRLRSIFVHPVFLAESMALLAVLTVSAYIYLRNPVFLVIAAGAAVAVALTMLVKTVVALGLTLGLLLLRKRPWLVAPYAIGSIAAMVSFAEYGSDNFRRQIETYITSPRSVRREAYRIAGEILLDAPLLGVGPGQFGGFAATFLQSQVRYEYGFINYDGQIYTTVDAHWPHLIAEIGLLGLFAYGTFLGLAALTAWRLSLNPRASPYQRTVGMTAAVFLVVVMIEGVAAQNMEDTLCGFMAFSMLGFAQRQRVEEESVAQTGTP